MVTQLGVIAGEILNLLESKKETMSIVDIEMNIGQPLDLILMSVGWLTREGYVTVQSSDEEYMISLAAKGKGYEELNLRNYYRHLLE